VMISQTEVLPQAELMVASCINMELK
jgi:hypothetical protein